MKRAYIFGCSHAAGSEMFDNDPDREYTHSYPALIARDLGYDVHNHAIPGGSNDAIFRALIDRYDSIDQQDLVIFCWAGGSRVEIYCERNHQWLPFAQGQHSFHKHVPHRVALQGVNLGVQIDDAQGWQNYKKLWERRWLTHNEHNEKPQEYRNILAANCLANSRTGKVINIHAWAAHDHPYRRTVKQFFWPVGTDEFCGWCLDQGFVSTDWGHFGFDAHRAFADYVLDGIDLDKYRCSADTE